MIEIPDFSEAFYYGRFADIDYSMLKRPIIIKLHGTFSYFSTELNNYVEDVRIYDLEKKLFNNATGVLAISNQVKRVSEELFNIYGLIEKIPNGINLPERVEYQGKNSKTVVFAGTLTEKKGVFSLIKAWDIIHAQNPEYQLHLYGKGVEYFIKQLNFNIPSSVQIKGVVPFHDLIEIYSHSACAIFPSYSESMGMAPVEAMSVGCPTIFTRRSTGPEIIEDGVDGKLVDPDNIMEIAETITNILTYREFAIELGINGIKKVKTLFDIRIVADRHIEYYKQFLKKR